MQAVPRKRVAMNVAGEEVGSGEEEKVEEEERKGWVRDMVVFVGGGRDFGGGDRGVYSEESGDGLFLDGKRAAKVCDDGRKPPEHLSQLPIR